jgi:hypothetical protein
MAYPQLEDLCSRKREKVALFLTAENMAGVLAIALPAYSATLQTTFWLRLLILLAACVLGLVLTSEINGLACYERVLWRVRGWARRRTVGATLRPAEFTAIPVAQGDRALPAGGPLRRVTAPGAPPGRPAPRAGAAYTAAPPRARGTGTNGVPNGNGAEPVGCPPPMGQDAPGEVAMTVHGEGRDADL